MPAPDSTTHRSLTLPNSLRVVLCSAPRLKRCAAALRVAAGSHDVPEQWPGLAHFLEHLFFLGTERFPADQNLMAYVQRHGGQVNASTRERTTDFFFELAPPLFAGGLERLCEMLTQPRMTLADQLREREVLHAEFIAWSRDDASRDQLQLLQPLSPLHPLRWFHAGNRFSLPVPRPAFQQALQDFYRAYYQAGQVTLSLAGPQTLDDLQALATRFGGYFAKGSRVNQLQPPPLVDNRPAEPPTADDARRMDLIFACEGLPEGHEQAAAFLCAWINNAQPGGLIAQLRDKGLIESLKAQVLYEFAGQVVLDLNITPSSNDTGLISALVFDWLAFFKTRYRELCDEYARLEQRRLQVSSALLLARHYSANVTDLNEKAISALLDHLTPTALLRPVTLEPHDVVNWRLPEPNPFLREACAPDDSSVALPALTFSNTLAATGEATLYLRWTLPSPQPKLHQMLNDSLKALTAEAQQAGVTLAFTAYGEHWQLKLSGLAEPIPAVLEHTLTLLAHPDAQTLASYGQPSREPVPIPIRQLLKTLPDHLLSSTSQAEIDDLQTLWAKTRWIGFTTGFQGPHSNALTHAMNGTPGTPETQTLQPSSFSTDQEWATEPSDASEDAVLMFYPAPTDSLEDEALWRLFAQLVQAPFYQRLRVELQLGYAVFSGFRQIAGVGGMLFGVQSPTASAKELVEHIETFMKTLPALIEQTDVPALIAVLQNQLDPDAMDSAQAAEMLWQAHLAGHGADYAEELQHSFAKLHPEAINRAASRIALSETHTFTLSNRAKPSAAKPGRP